MLTNNWTKGKLTALVSTRISPHALRAVTKIVTKWQLSIMGLTSSSHSAGKSDQSQQQRSAVPTRMGEERRAMLQAMQTRRKGCGSDVLHAKVRNVVVGETGQKFDDFVDSIKKIPGVNEIMKLVEVGQ